MLNKLRSKIKSAIEKKAIKIVITHVQKQINMNTTNKSWKTTLVGLLEGAVPVGWALVDAYSAGAFTGKHGLALALGVLMVIKGIVSKDADKTGLPANQTK